MPTRPAFPGPSTAELAALVREHRPATVRAPSEDGVVTLPVDWRTLPMTAVLWRRRGSDDQPLLIDGVLVSAPSPAELVGRDARSGEERWRVEMPNPLGSTSPHALAGCGRVVVLGSRRVAGLDPTTGEARWEIPLDENWAGGHSDSPSMEGCQLALPIADDAMRLAIPFETSRVLLVDVRTGRITAQASCPAPCALVSTEREGAVVRTEANLRWLFPWERGEPARLPAGTRSLTPELAIASDADTLIARDRVSGEVRWRRELRVGPVLPSPRGVLAQVADDLVVLDGSALVRVSAATGEDVWRTPLSEELAHAFRGPGGHAHDQTRLVLGARAHPQVLLELDLSTGAARSLRISAIDPVELALDGDLLAVRSGGQLGVVDLSLDAPPIRERLSLEDDVVRAIGALTARQGDSRTPWGYPRSREQALEWLRRLRPVVGDVVSPYIERAELGTASALLAALQGLPSATPMAVSVLERTYGCAPTVRLAWIREAASIALEPPLGAAQADELARETLAWLRDLEPRRADVRLYDSPDGAAWAAVMAGRDALLRTSASSAPLRALEDAIRRLAPAALTRRCVPSDDDAARATVLRYEYELATSTQVTVRVPGARCIEVQTLGGPLEVVTGGEASRPWVLVGPAVEVTDLGEYADHAPLPWPDAPARAIPMTYYGGPLASQREVFIVQRVDGTWRVVWTTGLLWVS